MKPFDVGVTVGMAFAFGWLLAKWRYSRGFYGRLSSQLLTKLEAERSRADEWRDRCSGLVESFHELREALEAYVDAELALVDHPEDDDSTMRARNLNTLMSVMKRTHP